jgi:hypothetical protein
MGHFAIATHLLNSKESFVNWLNNQRDEVAVGYALMGLDNPVAHWLRSEVPEIIDFEISYDGIELEYMDGGCSWFRLPQWLFPVVHLCYLLNPGQAIMKHQLLHVLQNINKPQEQEV